jgi:outer membrane protein
VRFDDAGRAANTELCRLESKYVRLNDLKAGVSVGLVLLGTMGQQAQAQQAVAPQQPVPAQVTTSATQPAAPQAIQNDTTGTPGLPQAPQPKLTEPLYLRDTAKDYTHLKGYSFKSLAGPFAPYTATNVPQPRLGNTGRLSDLLRDGKIYLSLSDAVTLALENNYDIAIARINLDIADTDILRTKAGASFRGVSTGLVTNTLGGSTTTISGGGGPGGTSSASGGSGAGAGGIVLDTNGGGPVPYSFDPVLTGTSEWQRASTQASGALTPSSFTNTWTNNIKYEQGFSSGTLMDVTFDNSRQTTNSIFSSFSPLFNTTFQAQITQHLLQGFGPKLNRRFIVEAKNNRRITDSSFRQQIIYTVTQIESIYWSLVSAYEDEQAKARALQQSSQLTADNRKQLEIGTLAPLDVVNSDSAVATDKQALITSQSNLEYQQLLMKQAIARTLNDPQLANAPVIPTDRVGLDRLPEEDMPVEDLVKEAFTLNPQIEQAVINMENNQITIKGEKNGLLPIVDLFGYYGGSGVGGQAVPCNPTTLAFGCSPNNLPASSGYGSVLGNTFNNNTPNYAVGVNVNISLRNRVAQADQARSQMELRQSEMRLQQLYTQIRIQVINAQYALTNDRANVIAAQTARDFNAQSLEAEQKKYRLGASTTANVLSQERTLATGENNLISATAAYAKDRSSLQQILSNTLDRYGISLIDAASGTVTQQPQIPGLTSPKAPEAPKPLSATPAAVPQ